MHALATPWSETYMQRALLELVVLGVVGGVLGAWVLFFRLAYGAESLAHALFPGLVIAALAGLPLLAGGAVGVLGAAAAVALVGRERLLGRDTAVAVVVTTLFGLGVLLALSPATPPGLDTLLFGDLLGVSPQVLAVSGLLGAVLLGSLALLHRPLLVAGFDRDAARALGVDPTLVELALLVLVAGAIVVGVQALGNLLVFALLVGPAATARLLTRRLLPMMAAGACLAIATSVAGLYVSFYADTAAGATVSGLLVAAYALALIGRALTSRFR